MAQQLCKPASDPPSFLEGSSFITGFAGACVTTGSAAAKDGGQIAASLPRPSKTLTSCSCCEAAAGCNNLYIMPDLRTGCGPAQAECASLRHLPPTVLSRDQTHESHEP